MYAVGYWTTERTLYSNIATDVGEQNIDKKKRGETKKEYGDASRLRATISRDLKYALMKSN